MHSRSEYPSSPEWRLIDTPPAEGAWNMAVDEALAASVRAEGAPVLRFYRWEPACLSLGRNQPARGRYDLAALEARGISVVRRPTGGRAVLHHRELTYSVALPAALLGSPRQAYAAVNRALVEGLRRLGVAAALQPASDRRAPVPSVAPCFAEPVEGEVVAAGRKLVGSAQRVVDGVLLQHGSLPIEDDQSLVSSLTVADAASSMPPVGEGGSAALAALLGRVPEWKALTGALAAGWTAALGARLRADALTAEETARAEEARARYASPAWTWHQ
ncbi:MAG TPA: lipoate--protein ligase family protein [Longimicrobium sp.]|nr:lipoate--protein ligase family protein [Longimicrobium sp.]